MDIFDEEIFRQMERGNSVEQPKCITQNDVTVLFMWIYFVDLFIRFVRTQNWCTRRNLTYHVERCIIRNIKNGNDNEDDHED